MSVILNNIKAQISGTQSKINKLKKKKEAVTEIYNSYIYKFAHAASINSYLNTASNDLEGGLNGEGLLDNVTLLRNEKEDACSQDNFTSEAIRNLYKEIKDLESQISTQQTNLNKLNQQKTNAEKQEQQNK